MRKGHVAVIVGLLALLLLLLPPANAQTVETVEKARRATKAWLMLVDSGKYAGSWVAASPTLKSAVSREGWESRLRSIRTPLGKLRSRSYRSIRYSNESLPNAPDGESATIEYNSKFGGGEEKVERIVLRADTEGVMRVSAYFVE